MSNDTLCSLSNVLWCIHLPYDAFIHIYEYIHYPNSPGTLAVAIVSELTNELLNQIFFERKYWLTVIQYM